MKDAPPSASSTFERLAAHLRPYEMRDVLLTPETKLIEIAEWDLEEFGYLMEGVERAFEIRQPRIIRLWPYLKALWRWNGFELGHVFRLFDRHAYIRIEDNMTIADLCAAIDVRKWPAELIIPPDAIDEGLVDNG